MCAGELRFSMRSLERFLPWWKGHIFVVAPNQVTKHCVLCWASDTQQLFGLFGVLRHRTAAQLLE